MQTGSAGSTGGVAASSGAAAVDSGVAASSGAAAVGTRGGDELSAVFSALADPTRRSILMRLMAGDASVAELAEPFAMSQPAVSKHLKVLEGAGLISRSRVATSRYSHLEAQPLREANEWMQRYKKFWNESFDRLDAALAEYMRQEEESND